MRQLKSSYLLALCGALGCALGSLQAAAPANPQGFITAKDFLSIGGVNVADLTGNAKYPASPDIVSYPERFEWPTTADGSPPPGDVRNDYGVEIEGYFYPEASGLHYFAIASDDGGDLFLSTDENPANAVRIGVEPVWSGVRAFGGDARRGKVDVGTADERNENRSKGISLTANRPYYIRARMKEGGGGDNLAVMVSSDPSAIADGAEPIPGNRLSSIDRTDTTLPYFGALTAAANGFEWVVFDGSGAGAKTVASATGKLGDNTVPVTVITKNGQRVVRYAAADIAAFLASGSSQSVSVTLTDSAGGTQTRTASVVVATWVAAPATPPASGPTSRGLTFRPYQTIPARPGGNLNWATDSTLAGGQIDPDTQTVADNIADLSGAVNGVYVVDVINFEQDGGDINLNPDQPQPDNFNSVEPASSPKANGTFPGIAPGDPNNIVGEVAGYLELPAGLVRLGVNSDDGFRLSLGSGTPDQFGTMLGQFDGGRGATDSMMDVVVATAGLYPFRLIWSEGGGGANLEFFSENVATGERTLINDPTVGSSIKAYRAASTFGSAIASALPPGGATGQGILQPVKIVLQDGSGSRTVDQASVALKVNGATATPTFARSGNRLTVSYTPTTAFGFGANVPVELTYAEVGGTPRVTTWTFQIIGFGPDDLPAAGAIVIEAEDYNYENGKHVAAASTMPYTGGAYEGLAATLNVDYFNADGNDSDVYRPDSAPNNVNLNDNLGGRYGTRRPGFDMASNLKLGWVAGGDWQQYTRTVPAGFYNVYAALSFDGTGPSQLSASLDVVTGDATQPNPTLRRVGSFDAPGSGGWGANNIVQMNDATGQKAVIKVAAGDTTLRFNLGSGDFDWFVLTRAVNVPPIVDVFTPKNEDVVAVNTPVNFTVADGSTVVTVASVKVTYNGADVTSASTISKAADVVTVRYTPAGQVNGTKHTYTIDYQGGSITQTYYTTPLGTANQFIVEAEDFNYDGGVTKTEASVMPYTGAAYDGLSAVAGVDYASTDGGDSDLYRLGETPNKSMDATGATDRGSWTQTVNYKLGWTDTGDWGNYTRTIPNGTYKVWAALSHGNSGANLLRAKLSRVTSAANVPAQTLADIGSFVGSGTAGWGANRLVPLVDAGGAIREIAFGGTETLRVNLDSGDFDYLVLQAVSLTPTTSFQLTATRNGAGNLVLTWEGGAKLTSSATLDGAYTDVTGSSGIVVTPDAASQFYKLRAP